jgi:hypothetical protein
LIRYLSDEEDCSRFAAHSKIFAVVMNTGLSAYSQETFVPQINLAVNAKDEWVDDVLPLLTFNKLPSRSSSFRGEQIIDQVVVSRLGVNEEGDHDNEYEVAVFCNEKAVSPKRNIQLGASPCLVAVWVHRHFPKSKQSPLGATDIDSSDVVVIQRALAANPRADDSTLDGVSSAVGSYCSGLGSAMKREIINLCGYIVNRDDGERKHNEHEIEKAKHVQTKLQRLSQSEKTAKQWIYWRLQEVQKAHQRDSVNENKPRILQTMQECLTLYEAQEVSTANVMECEQCNDVPLVAARQIAVRRTPNVLMLHISREDEHDRDKLISYPTKKALTFNGELFDLFGVVNHYGWSANSGHYSCHAKSLQKNSWFEFDDRSVRPIYPPSPSKDATLLFYHKRSN